MATHTIDVMHVIEKLWKAGECLYQKGSKELERWMKRQKKRLYGGDVSKVVAELRRKLNKTPRTGPGNKGKRERLTNVIKYIEKRLDRLNYKELLEQDLEIGSGAIEGAIEGAIKNIIGKRCDHGGMRWIKERLEALIQLRCIEVNGHWDEFVAFVAEKMKAEATAAVRRRAADRRPALPASRRRG